MLICANVVWETIHEQWIGIWLLMDTIIYHFISFLYQKFIVLASLRVFDGDVYDVITSSIYSIIGVVALFMLAYELLNTMINVDKQQSGESIKKIIINIVSSMLMLVLVPTVFDFMFDFQNSILKHNVLGKLFLPTYTTQTDYGYDTDGDGIIDTEHKFSQEEIDAQNLKVYGSSAATQIFQGFFYPTNSQNKSFSTAANEIIAEDISSVDPLVTNTINLVGCIGAVGAGASAGTKLGMSAGAGVGTAGGPVGTVAGGAVGAVGGALVGGLVGGVGCLLVQGMTSLWDFFTKETIDLSLQDAYNSATLTGDFQQFKYFGEFVQSGEITYHYIFSSIVGGIVVYILAIYCIDVAVRAVKLAFYQMIAPIPIITRIVPKQEGVFKNWLKCVGSCYFEVFIRLAALYLAVFFIANVPDMITLALDDNSVAYDLATGSFGLGVFVKANIILGIFIFVKQIPNIISDVTGIKSGNFSLNIMDHLKEAAGAGMVGSLARKTVAGIDAKKNGYKFSQGFKSIEGSGPVAKWQKFKNTLMPYTARTLERNRQASEQMKEIEHKRKIGEQLLQKYGDSGKYIESLNDAKYSQLKDVYAHRKHIKGIMLDYQAQLDAAKVSGDVSEIARISKLYTESKDQYDSYDNEFKQMLDSKEYKDIGENYSKIKFVEDRSKFTMDITRSQNTNNNPTNLVYRTNRTSESSQVKFVKESEFKKDNKEPQIIIPDNVDINSTVKPRVQSTTVGNNSSVLEKLNNLKKEIEQQMNNEKNSKYKEEAQRELDEVNRKISKLTKDAGGKQQ